LKSKVDILESRLNREITARKQAEQLLEEKAKALFDANLALKDLNADLEAEIEQRTMQLSESESKFRQLVEKATEIIYNVNLNGLITYVNHVGIDQYGYSEEDIIGKPFTIFIPEPYKSECFNHYMEFMLSGKSSDYYETPVITKFGSQSWFGQNTNRVVDNDGTIYFSVFARDIDKRRRAEVALEKAKLEIEKSEIKYRSIIENMQLGLMEVDLDNTIIKVYPHFNEMTGYSGDELIGQNAPKIFGLEENEKVLERQANIEESGATGIYELQLRKKDGELIWVMISGAPFFDEHGNVAGSIGIHYDITDRKNLESELIQAKKKAEAAQEAEKLFLASMSHEIRTPLNAIIGMSHLMNETTLNETQKDYLQILQSSANILQHLISDILDISKIDSSSFELNINSLNLHELCTSLLRSFDYKKQNKQIDFILDFDESIKHQIFSDAQALSQILINLISNAEKFTAEGKVTLSIKNELEHNDGKAKICISVQDTGVGISEEKQAHIFDRFKQADKSINSEYGGTGLGLYISRQLVNLLGGELRVVSKEGQGACFYFCFEVELDLSSGELSVQNPSPVNKGLDILKGMRVLVAEDNTMNQRYISTLLNKVGIIFDIGNDGLEAVELYTNKEYDLILMDLQMPGMDGFEATQEIKKIQTEKEREVPILALTASSFLSKKQSAMAQGMAGFISKPFAPKQLYDVLLDYVEKGAITEALRAQNLKEQNTSISNLEHGSVVFDFQEEIDLEYLNEAYGDDLEYAKEMFVVFLSIIDEAMEALYQVVENQETEKIKQQAHKIKPTFTMIGLSSITQAMSQIEKAALEGDHQKTKSMYVQISGYLKKMLPQVEAQMQQF